MADLESPPPYESIVAKVEQDLGANPTPDKIIDTVASLSTAEKQAVAGTNVDFPKTLQWADEGAFQRGIYDYLKSEAAQARLKFTADEATNACKLIDKMFSDLAVKLGEVDGKNVGTAQKRFTPEFLELQKIPRNIAHKHRFGIGDVQLRQTMGKHHSQICLDSEIPLTKKKEKLKEFIDAANRFETSSNEIIDGLDDLKHKFGGFTGQFGSWADEAEKKADAQIAQLLKEIETLHKEIAEIKKKMVWTGVIGSLALVGVTAGLCVFLGPVGLIAGLIGLGVELGFMIHWSTEIIARDDQIRLKTKQMKQAQSDKDAIVATRHQLTELGQTSLTLFQDQVGKLSSVWTFALNDAKKVDLILKDIDKDIDDVAFKTIRQSILESVGSTQGLYQVMATYLERYADGVKASEVPKP